MAQVRQTQLSMGQDQENNYYASVRCEVEFSPAELNRNIQYGLYIGLYTSEDAFFEQHPNNTAFQTFFMPPTPPSYGTGDRSYRDGFVMWVSKEQLSPNQMQTHHLERRASFDWNRLQNLRSNPNFRAFVWVVPEISEAQGLSPVQANQFRARF
jgi:hypothetical protein